MKRGLFNGLARVELGSFPMQRGRSCETEFKSWYAARMIAHGITPILNVSDIGASFDWFGKWGWEKAWDWGTPASFGAVKSGVCQIFLCRDGQGGRGRGANTATFGPNGDEDRKSVV